MTASTQTITMDRWTLDAEVEPVVRVGVVLEEDGADALRLTLDGVSVRASDGAGWSAAWDAGTKLEAARKDRGLRVTAEGESSVSITAPLRLEPAAPAGDDAGVWLHGVRAGRGFHWQKPVDQRFAGSIEIVPTASALVAVNELPLEDYLAGVITAEMGAQCPLELLKAQCIVARSWLLAMTEPKHDADPFDRCNDDCCQRYQGNSALTSSARRGADESRGVVLLHPGGGVLDANYSKSCGGVSELAEHVWGEPKPGISTIVDAPPGADAHAFFPVTEDNLDAYLDGDWIAQTQCYCSTRAVPLDAIGTYLGRVDEVDDYFRWTVRYAREEMEALLRQWLPDAASMTELRDLRVTRRGVSGRASHLEIDWLDTGGRSHTSTLDSEYRIRQAMHAGFLYSSAFAIRSERDTGGRLTTITLRGAGWGHGAGLCQIGALGMALQDIDADAICLHYYPDATLAKAYPDRR